MPAKFIPVGTRFGKLTVIGAGVPISRKGTPSKHDSTSIVSCECGIVKQMRNADLNRGNVCSCGCYKSALLSSKTKTHGMTGTKVYRAWCSMVARCGRKSHKQWKDYGGRGITVCERWRTFENFYADMGDPPAGYDLDRVDNNGNYEPGNCEWVTPARSTRNRRVTVMATIDGETKPLADFADASGVRRKTAYYRVRRMGWDHKRAVTAPVRSYGQIAN